MTSSSREHPAFQSHARRSGLASPHPTPSWPASALRRPSSVRLVLAGRGLQANPFAMAAKVTRASLVRTRIGMAATRSPRFVALNMTLRWATVPWRATPLDPPARFAALVPVAAASGQAAVEDTSSSPGLPARNRSSRPEPQQGHPAQWRHLRCLRPGWDSIRAAGDPPLVQGP